ncbi:hypothetical protein EDC39_11293 [Geothermobacter ehrlichii]|uniref:RNA polymerase sigma factor 70 region 4 type 2 domain-containing protein n=1 Tax=Geothermobacter ehrlichii TaxID=213224 RepID=A0A5D3WGY5_9BACT|nr:sigma factor-like helix-turn-helix DNA-binding protein [Geothermobacter ehrlichii]TYO96805.1 hypothetical protein EDC39_11293 [Geothermobacter ehrlichii]
MTAEDAVTWVNRNAHAIRGHIRKYLPFVPYDQEDFMQDAFEAALIAARIASEREIPFAACFWVTLRSKISSVTPHPESAHHSGSSSPPSTLCSSEDGLDRVEARPPSITDRIDMDRLFWMISRFLTQKESRVLGMAIGLDGGRRGIREIARILGCTPANVRQTLSRAYQRLSRLVESGQLKIRLQDLEYGETAFVQPCRQGIEKTEKPEAA